MPVLCHVFASALEMKCSLNANSCCWLTGSNKAWPPIVIYVKMGYITCSDFDGFVSQTEPSTMCKIAHFVRKMEGGGQNFHVNKFLASRSILSHYGVKLASFCHYFLESSRQLKLENVALLSTEMGNLEKKCPFLSFCLRMLPA